MASNVSSVYIHVVDDVINKVRDEFINFGVGENVLTELQALWEMKMLQCGAISGTIERPPPVQKPAAPITPVHDLNVPYEGPAEEYETPTAEMLFPPTPLQTPIQTPLPGTDQSMYNIPTGPSDYAPSPTTDIRNGVDLKAGRPSPYMQPPSSWMTQRPLGVDVNVAYVEGRDEVDRGASDQPMTQDFFMISSGKRKRDDYASQLTSGGYMPQQDGSGDVMIEFLLPENQPKEVQESMPGRDRETAIKILSKRETEAAPVLPQQDGVNDEYDDLFHFQGVANEDYNTPAEHVELRAATPAVGTPKPAKHEAVEDDEPPLNEDDDDDDDLDDLENGEEELNTQDLVLAQFDKVTRTKSRWKCTLKDGIMHINSRDILFNKATGEFEF
ncbi:transcription initiation factor IIA subunit 1 [Cocos nucifera]|uniref:Transcription initiation factor IIA subunit 1 n=1 Tax=Cocos nucifera TaxID=13894 RepID=A0A8K0IZ13_COCNU|nr:transcription initiation factor IIA subunit 1 [Cocos nucifera]